MVFRYTPILTINNSVSPSEINDKQEIVTLSEKKLNIISKLQIVYNNLEDSRLTFEKKHKNLFIQCIRFQQAKETVTAITLAIQCAQARKTSQIIFSGQLALKQAIFEVETARASSDITMAVPPIIQKVKERLVNVIPEATKRLGHIEQTLDSFSLENEEKADYLNLR